MGSATSSLLQSSQLNRFSRNMPSPSLILLLVPAVALGQQLMEPRIVEPEERLAFSNYTSSLFGAFPVTSSAYSTFALAVAGVVAGLLFAYALLTDSLSALLSSSRSSSPSSSSFFGSQNLFDILTSVVLPALERD